MTLEKNTKLGKITLSKLYFAQIIAGSLQQPSCADKVWASTKRGRLIGAGAKLNLSDLASHIEIEQSEAGYALEFSVITKFGASIRQISDLLADDIAERLQTEQGEKPAQIKIRIAGVKSKQIARREVEVVKSYAVE